jgi:hypothetical protein
VIKDIITYSGGALTLAKEQDLGLALGSGVILPPVIIRADQAPPNI